MEYQDPQQQKGIGPSQQELASPLLSGVLHILEQREQYITARSSIQDLVRALAHPQWEIRSAAVHALGKLGTEVPVAPLLTALQDEHRMVRAAAVRALGQSGTSIPMEHLIIALRDEEWEVREMTVLTLDELGNSAAEPLLRIALQDNHSSVRDAALSALHKYAQTSPALAANIEKQISLQNLQPRTHTWSPQQTLFHTWLVLNRQIPILNKSTWLVPILAMTIVGILVFALKADAGWTLTIATIMVSVIGAAYMYGAENDAGLEIALSTPTLVRTILVTRLVVVLGYTLGWAALASGIVVLAHGGDVWTLIHLWLGPALFLSSLSLALSLMVGSLFAVTSALLIEASQIIKINPQPLPILQLADLQTSILWRLPPTLLILVALGCLAFAILYAPHLPRLAH